MFYALLSCWQVPHFSAVVVFLRKCSEDKFVCISRIKMDPARRRGPVIQRGSRLLLQDRKGWATARSINADHLCLGCGFNRCIDADRVALDLFTGRTTTGHVDVEDAIAGAVGGIQGQSARGRYPNSTAERLVPRSPVTAAGVLGEVADCAIGGCGQHAVVQVGVMVSVGLLVDHDAGRDVAETPQS